jgi:very-short-patch-repair endonuclease
MKVQVELKEEEWRQLIAGVEVSPLLAKINKQVKAVVKKRNRKERIVSKPIVVKKIEFKKKIVPLDPSVAEEYKKKLIKDATPSEKIIKACLKALQIKYEFQHIIWVNPRKFYIGDFYLPEYGIILEIDGGYHNKEAQQKIDKVREREINSLKYKVVRMANELCGTSQIHLDKLSMLLNNNKQRVITGKGKNI